MCTSGFSYCDVVLPVPVDHLFTYRIAQHLYKVAQPGTRVLVPFGPREVMGTILLRHNNPPSGKVRDIIQLLDDQPVLTSELIQLAHWIAEYYNAPLGEVFKTMISLAGSTRTKKVVSLTAAGRMAAAHFSNNGNDDSIVHTLNLKTT
jgi:primosomal protein N' (replication factor Y)